MSKKLYFGLKKSKVEPLDKLVSFNYEKVDMPIKFNLKDQVKQIYDQGNINSCSANAAANFLSLSDKMNIIKCNVSRLYLYFCTRWIDNNYVLPVEDIGCTLASVFTAISKYHYIDEQKYPYYTHLVNDIPYKHIFEEAFKNNSPIVSYRQILPSVYAIKYILYKLQLPVLFGMQVYTNFMNLTKENDILKLPTEKDELLGGHAVLIVGYSDESNTFDILNSHGSQFADNGYFRMPYEYALNHNLCWDFYVVNS